MCLHVGGGQGRHAGCGGRWRFLRGIISYGPGGEPSRRPRLGYAVVGWSGSTSRSRLMCCNPDESRFAPPAQPDHVMPISSRDSLLILLANSTLRMVRCHAKIFGSIDSIRKTNDGGKYAQTCAVVGDRQAVVKRFGNNQFRICQAYRQEHGDSFQLGKSEKYSEQKNPRRNKRKSGWRIIFTENF